MGMAARCVAAARLAVLAWGLCVALPLGAPWAARPCAAQALVLELPLACAMGPDCTVFQYFDQDPGLGRRDYACGTRTYDGHTGTDLRARDLAHMRAGVPVLAAAPGVVRAVRDHEPDVDARTLSPGALDGREAGNAVVLDHPGGWQTQYSHLRQGSVAVAPGQTVRAGQALGLVGMSGAAAFAHLELIVRRDGAPVDPFTGAGPGREPGQCAPGPGALWSPQALAALAYREIDLLSAGFATAPPDKAALDAGPEPLEHLAPGAPALVFWARLAGVRTGDELACEVLVPGGRTLARKTQTLERDQNAYSVFIGGRLAQGARWPAGEYRARLTLRRKAPGGGWHEPLAVERRLTSP